MKLPHMTALFAVPYRQRAFAGENRDGHELEGIRMEVDVPRPEGEGGPSYKGEHQFVECQVAWAGWCWENNQGKMKECFDFGERKCAPLKYIFENDRKRPPGDLGFVFG